MLKIKSLMQEKTSIIIAGGIIAVIIIMVALLTLPRSDNQFTGNSATFAAKQGLLIISVTESGTIQAREQVIIKSEVEGKTTILYIIPEGTKVKKGELLVELDASRLLDNRIDRQIKVQNVEAAYISASENLAVAENQAKSDVDKAEMTLQFAEQDLEKYLKGEYPNELKETEARITLAEEEVARAKEKLKWSKKLYNEKYISQTELRADELAEKKKVLDLELAQNNLNLLKNYSYKRKLAQLKSDRQQAEMALTRAKRKAKADIAQAKAGLRAKESEFEREKDKLDKNEKQIKKTKIYAPSDGLAIYATSAQSGHRRGRVEPLDAGQEVRERQELIYLPTASLFNAEIGIHESSLDKVSLDLPVKLTVEALPGKIFSGRVTKIAPLPDAQSAWMNPDLKIYKTEIHLDTNSGELRTGMSCRAEIIIAQYDEALYIPIQAVIKVKDQTTVYVKKGRTFEPRQVEIGLDNNRMVHIISGLQPDEMVSLTPPLAPAAVTLPKGKMPSRKPSPPDSGSVEMPKRKNPSQKPTSRDSEGTPESKGRKRRMKKGK